VRGEVRRGLGLVLVHLGHTNQTQYAECMSREMRGKGVVVVDGNALNIAGPKQDITSMG